MSIVRRLLTLVSPYSAAAVLLCLSAGCPPKPPPPSLPPREVPRLDQINDSNGERGDVITDAVQTGSNQARIQYDCAASSKGVDGKGVLSAEVNKCEFDRAQQTLVLSNGSAPECPTFLLTVNNFRGRGTYNTALLGKLSFGSVRMRSQACSWDGNMCLDWNGSSSEHGEANCTIEINSDGGLQFGTVGATISGTFVCADFNSPWKGCAGSPAKATCLISRASFSVAGCTVTAAKPGDPKGKGEKGIDPKNPKGQKPGVGKRPT